MPKSNKFLFSLLIALAMQLSMAWAIQQPVSGEAINEKLSLQLTGRLRPLFLTTQDFCGIEGVLTKTEVKHPGSEISPGKILGFTRPPKSSGAFTDQRDKLLAKQQKVLIREFANKRIGRAELDRRTSELEEAFQRAKKTREYPFFSLRSGLVNGKPPAVGDLMEFVNPFADKTLNGFARSDAVCSLEITVPEDKRLLVRSLFYIGDAARKTDVHLAIDVGNYTEIQDRISWSQLALESGRSMKMRAELPIHDFFESDMNKEYPCVISVEAEVPAEMMKRAQQVAKLWARVEADEPVAMVALARCLKTGFGGDPDPYAAIELLERASELKYGAAMYELSLVYREGVWVLADEKKADDLLRQAAKLGSLAARLELEQ